MIRLNRAVFFQCIRPTAFCLIRNNSESSAVKPKSGINKLEIQEDINKASLSSELKEKLSLDFQKKKTVAHNDLQKENDISPISLLSHSNLQTSNLPAGFQHFKNSMFKKVYDLQEAQNLTKTLSPSQVIEVMKILATSKSRPPELLKALSSKIQLALDKLNMKNYADIMYCSAVLSFKDLDLLNKVSERIIYHKKNIESEKLAASILHSCGKLKYRNCNLIDSLLIYLLSRKSSLEEMLTGLITLGVVNYISPHGVVLINELLKLSDVEFPVSTAYIDFVWACVLLEQYPVSHISKILSEDFIEHTKVLYAPDKYFSSTSLKIQNINSAATYLMHGYSGPKLDAHSFVTLQNSNINPQYFTSVIDGLSHIFPKSGFLEMSIDTGAGFLLDIKCCMDKNGEPLPLEHSKEEIKIGIMLLQYNDVCLGKPKTICGIAKFKERILEAQGYKVIHVFWDEYNSEIKLYDKVGYLREKLKKCITS